MKKHRFNIFPEMQEDDYALLKNDIRTNGFDKSYPIYTYQGEIIDGWNRYRACNEIGVTPVFVQFAGSDIDAIMFVMRTNKRRNLTSSQKGCIAVEAEELIKAVREETEKERVEKLTGNENAKTKVQLIVPSFSTQPAPPKKDTTRLTSHKIAEALGTNRTYVSEAAKIKETNPEAFERIKSGEVTITEVMKEQKKQAVIEKVVQYQEELRQESSFDIDIFNTDKKFNIIYADPAWRYWDGGEKNQSLHYQTMTIDEICKLPVKNITDDNCILFLWVTYPILQEAFKVIESWGFKYSTCGFIWVKKNKVSDSWFFGNGAWTRANSELCLIATKGSIARLDASISQVLDDKIMEHSRKPARVRWLITKLVGELPRIELFSRCQENDGWFNWGNNI